MSYAKSPLAVQDYAVGFQTVNQARDNLDAVRIALQAAHGEEFTQLASGAIITRGAGLAFFGNHNTPAISRAVVEVNISGGTLVAGILRPAIPPVVLSVTRMSPGLYFLPIINLATFWGRPEVRDNGTNPNFIQIELKTYALGAAVPGILCSLYSLSGGIFQLEDYPFSLAVYGTP